jgi:hypothetical protein
LEAEPPPQGVPHPHCVLVDFSFCDGPPFFEAEDRRTWVPVFPRTVADDVRRDVTRTQIPLVLAWAITPWKAQGMTLRRAVVSLEKRLRSPACCLWRSAACGTPTI